MAPRLLTVLTAKIVPATALALVALMAMPVESATKKGSGNPFDQLNGYWTGGGTVTPPKGSAEKVSCRVTYSVAGSAVTQNMRCAGTDYKFNTSSQAGRRLRRTRCRTATRRRKVCADRGRFRPQSDRLRPSGAPAGRRPETAHPIEA